MRFKMLLFFLLTLPVFLQGLAAWDSYTVENIRYMICGTVDKNRMIQFQECFSRNLAVVTEQYFLEDRLVEVVVFENAALARQKSVLRFRNAAGYDVETNRFIFVAGSIFAGSAVAEKNIRHEQAHYVIAMLALRNGLRPQTKESFVLSELFAQVCEPSFDNTKGAYAKTYDKFILENYAMQLSKNIAKVKRSNAALATFGLFLRKKYSIKELAAVIATTAKRNEIAGLYDKFAASLHD